MNERQLTGDNISESMIYEKSRKLHSDLLQGNTSISTTHDEFKSSRGWLDKFHKRSVIHCVIRQGKVSSSDKAAAGACKKEFMKAEGTLLNKCSTEKQGSSGRR